MLLPFGIARVTGALRQQLPFALCLSFAFLMLFGVFFLVGYQSWVKDNVAWLYLFLVIICMLINRALYYFGLNKPGHFLMILLPLTAMPVLGFVVLELMFCMRHVYGYTIHYKLIFVATLLVIQILFLFYVNRKVTAGFNAEKIIKAVLAPSVLIAFLLLVYYFPLLPTQRELFESANIANSVMNVFEFNEIPILDFSSAHMLSEQWFGYLYASIFGWRGQQDFLIYSFFNMLLVYLILYWLLNKLFSRPMLSIFFILLFPFIRTVFFHHIFMAVLPLFLTRQLLERPTAGAFLKLMFLLPALILWKIDTGAAAVFSSLIYFPLVWFLTGSRFPLKPFLKALCLFTLVCLAGLVCTVLLRSPEQILTSCKMLLHLFAASQAHGYSQIMANPPQQFYVYHVLFPFAGVLFCIYIAFELKKKYKSSAWKNRFLLLSSLFLFLMFFGNLQRALVRHGFAERGEDYLSTTFFAAVALLIAYWCHSRKAIMRMTVFYTAAFFLYMILKFFPYSSDGYAMENALANNTFQTNYSTLDWKQYHGRTLIDTAFENENYKDLKSFLDDNLTPQQTFIDFSNTPTLYFYCERRVVGYFTQNMQNTVDDYLQRNMLLEAKPDKAPVVIFANYPRNFFDATDDVPNNLRYYLVAEHIFEHYRPYGVIGNKSIWVSKSFHTLPKPVTTDTLLARADTIPFNLLAEYNALFYNDPVLGKEHAKDLDLVFRKVKNDLVHRNDSLFLVLDQNLLALKHCYLSVEFHKRPAYFEPFTMQLCFTDNELNTVGVFSFTRRDNVSSEYLFRLSNHYFWHQHNSLQLCIPEGTEVKSVSLMRDKRLGN